MDQMNFSTDRVHFLLRKATSVVTWLPTALYKHKTISNFQTVNCMVKLRHRTPVGAVDLWTFQTITERKLMDTEAKMHDRDKQIQNNWYYGLYRIFYRLF